MERVDALKALLVKVEAGDFDAPAGGARAPYFNGFMDVAEQAFSYRIAGVHRLAWDAYKGSLNEAKALHEAVLPGWTVRLCAYTPHGNSPPHAHVFYMRQTESDPVRSGSSSGYDGEEISRAWLIAILKALIAEGSK